MKDVHLNDVEQYLLLMMILMLNNNYMLNQVEHLLNKIKKKRNSIEERKKTKYLYLIDILIEINLEDYMLNL